jgi:hypothetical protein
MRTLLKLLPLLATALLALTATAPARAAACCMSATATGVGRLLVWEEFAVGLSSSMAYGMGRWTADGEWRPYSEDYTDIEWRTQLWGMFRLSEKWFVYGQLPFLMNQRSSGDLQDLDGGLADVQAGVRYEVLQIGEILELPAIALTGAVTAPTGRHLADAEGALASDATGRGAWVLSAGLSLEKTLLPWYVRLDMSASLPLAATRSDLGVSQQYGLSGEVALMGGLEVADNVVVSVFGRYAQEGALSLDQELITNSGQSGASVGSAVSWRLTPHWTVQGGVETGLFVDGLGDNQPGRVTTTLGLRYGHF